MRRTASYLAILSLIGSALGVPVTASAENPVQKALKERFGVSRIEIQNPGTQGDVVKRGAILILQADGVPANRLRVFQANTKFQRVHVDDYAKVESSPDGRLVAGPGEFSLAQGTRVVVLDIKVDRERVRLFTHTLTPVRLSDGRSGYGCTELVFRFEEGALARADLAPIERRIEQVVALAPGR